MKASTLSLRILAAIREADRHPATDSWAEVIEDLDLFCWTFGFNKARSMGRPSTFSRDPFDTKWFAAMTEARAEWEAAR